MTRRRPVSPSPFGHRLRITAGLIPALLGAAAATIAGLAAVATAQETSRSVMSRQDDDGSMQTLTYAIPDRAQLTAPDLRPADLPEVVARLDLSDAQASVAGDLIRVYVEAVDALPLEVPESGRGLLDEAEQGAVANADPMSDAVREAMAEFGFDPARLDDDLDVGIGIGIGMERTDPDSPPQPRVEANVTIGPGQGRTLPKEEMDRLRQVADAAARKIEAIAREQAMRDLMNEGGGGEGDVRAANDDRWAMIAERAQAMRDSVRQYRVERTRLRRQLDADLQGMLAEAQMQRWPSFDRWVLRHRQLPMGRLAGESVDVFGVLDDMAAVRPEVAEATAAARADLEIRLHELLSRRAEQAMDAGMDIDEACLAGDAAEIRRLATRLRDLHVRVRDANLQAIDLIGAVLADLPVEPDPLTSSSEPDDARPAAPNLGEHVRRELRRRAFPMAWATTPAQRAIAAVESMELTPMQREVVDEVAGVYAIEHETASRRIESLVIRHEPDRIAGGFDGILENLGAEPVVPPPPAPARGNGNGDGEGGMVVMITPRGPVAEALERRLALDKRTMQRLYGMFDAAVVATLPGLPDVADMAPAEGRAGDRFRGEGDDT